MTELATQELARARAARIRAGIQHYLHTLADIAGAYAQRDWTALGYADWQAYVDGEYSEHRLRLSPEHRQKAVAELRLAGMSQRAIGSALGVDAATVNRDLRAGVADATPAEIQGADGKTYAATRPSSPTGTDAIASSAALRTRPDQSGPGEVEPASEGGCGSTPSPDHPHPAASPAAQPEANGRLPRPGAGSSVETGANFGEVLDRLVPDPNPHREWQRRFLDAISGVHKVMRFTPEDVVEKADDQCIEELIRVTDLLADHRLSVVNARLASLPTNVTPIRRIS